jgi:DNA invertase Pin-like site-specific DNA recombinase
MLIGYARVSKADQNLDRQIDALINAGVDKRNIYQEKITGTKKERPELTKLINDLMDGDIIIIAELTRISRSTKDLFDIIGKIQEKKADIKSLKETWIDTTTPQGKLMFTIFAGLSQFERDLISQRTKEGLEASNARGRKGGRPSVRNEKAVVVEALYKQGIKIVDIVRQTELSRSTVNRIINDMKFK